MIASILSDLAVTALIGAVTYGGVMSVFYAFFRNAETREKRITSGAIAVSFSIAALAIFSRDVLPDVSYATSAIVLCSIASVLFLFGFGKLIGTAFRY